MPRKKATKYQPKNLKKTNPSFTRRPASKVALFVAIPMVTMAVEIMNSGLYYQHHTAMAVSYQNSVALEFTFDPTVSVTVSGDLTIDNLSPGNSADSNIITVSTASNNLAGYTMYATVGSDNNASPYYQTSDLKNGSNIFSMIPKTDLGLASLSGDNTWGYKYSTDSGATWSNYNGLPLVGNNTLALIDTSSASSSSIQFKIGAKAGATQIAGTYSNVVNFAAITKILTTNYTISYIDNSGEATGMPSGTSGSITSNTNLTLNSTTPTREGYTFAGWCTTTTSDDTCSGTTYQPGGTYVLNNTGGNVAISLYAMWESNVSLINFMIGNSIYQTEEGMIWADWVESKYNTDGRYVLGCGREGCDKYYIVDTEQSLEADYLSSVGEFPHYMFGGGTVCTINLYPAGWGSAVADSDGIVYNIQCGYWGGIE